LSVTVVVSHRLVEPATAFVSEGVKTALHETVVAVVDVVLFVANGAELSVNVVSAVPLQSALA
jgi:hypothetical protein